MKLSEWIGKRLQEFHFGHLVLGKLTFVVTIINFIILISLKWDFDPTNYLIPIFVVSVLIIWIFGWYLEKKGIRKHFQQAQLNGVEIKQKNNN